MTRPRLRRFLSRERVISLFVALVIGVALFVYAVRWLELKITFHPVRAAAGAESFAPRGAEDVWLTSNDGTRLHGWFFRAVTERAAATLIFFHGNGGNISNIGWLGPEFRSED